MSDPDMAVPDWLGRDDLLALGIDDAVVDALLRDVTAIHIDELGDLMWRVTGDTEK